MNLQKEWMKEALRLALEGMQKNEGGPFGAIIVRDKQIIGRGNNQVLLHKDPTAHAEVIAIRDACKNIQDFQLNNCEIYTSCEPCPMCLGAIYWARIKTIYYCCSREDAAKAGFDDAFIYDEFVVSLTERRIPLVNLRVENYLRAFEEWQQKTDKEIY